jgi:predicted metal-dependent peptidase
MTTIEELKYFISYLYIKKPFYNSLLSSLTKNGILLVNTEESKERKIYFKTDENKNFLYIDETFADNLILSNNKKRLFYYIVHEILHIILKHNTRRTKIKKDIDIWDISADIVIDNIISNDEFLKNILDIPLMKEENEILKEVKDIKLTVDDVYSKLLEANFKLLKRKKVKQKFHENKKNGKDGNDNSIDGDSEQHLENHNKWGKNGIKDKKVNEMILKAMEFTKNLDNDNSTNQYGGLPGYMVEEIKDLLKPKTNLKYYLNKIIQSKKKETNNYKRPDRRYLYNNLIVPSKSKTIKHFNLLFFIDTSGSMEIKDLKQSMSDIIDLLKSMNNKKQTFNVEIIHSDVEIKNKVILNEITFQKFDIKELLKIKGRGGTELTPLYKYLIEKDRNKFDAIIVNTDFHIANEEFQEYLNLRKKYNFLSLIPKDYNQEKVKQLNNEKCFFL